MDLHDKTLYAKLGLSLPPFNMRNALHGSERDLGLHNRDNRELRVRWVNTLRSIVGRSFPGNKSGAPLVSDVDLLLASVTDRVEAYYLTNKWAQEQNGTSKEPRNEGTENSTSPGPLVICTGARP